MGAYKALNSLINSLLSFGRPYLDAMGGYLQGKPALHHYPGYPCRSVVHESVNPKL